VVCERPSLFYVVSATTTPKIITKIMKITMITIDCRHGLILARLALIS
jgi:hypothetical protein